MERVHDRCYQSLGSCVDRSPCHHASRSRGFNPADAGTASAACAAFLRSCRCPGRLFTRPDAQSTGGGFLKSIPTPIGTASLYNVAIPPSYTLGLEAAISSRQLGGRILRRRAPAHAYQGDRFQFCPALGTDLLGSVRFGPSWASFNTTLPIRCLSALYRPRRGYVVMFSNNSDGILSNFSVDPSWSFVTQAGFDYMLTDFGLPNWGVFVDAKKLIYLNPDFQGIS